jgi:hypothetical protein
MDYLCIGSNGFAQVGDSDFYEKNRVEMAVLIEYLEENYPIQPEFDYMCCYSRMWFNHDFGCYSEIVLKYADRIVDNWQNIDPEKFDRFWRYCNTVEAIDLECDEITSRIVDKYKLYIQKKENNEVGEERVALSSFGL